MTAFDARLRVVGHSGLPLGVEVDLSDEILTVTSGGQPLAEWSIHDLQITKRSDGFHLEAEGEEVVLSFNDNTQFALEIGLI